MDKKLHAKRARDPDFLRIAAILNLLKEFPDGVWIREIARRLNTPPGPISRYVDQRLNDFIDITGFKNDDDKYIGPKIIKLKHNLLNKTFTAESVRKMMETQKFLKSIGK